MLENGLNVKISSPTNNLIRDKIIKLIGYSVAFNRDKFMVEVLFNKLIAYTNQDDIKQLIVTSKKTI